MYKNSVVLCQASGKQEVVIYHFGMDLYGIEGFMLKTRKNNPNEVKKIIGLFCVSCQVILPPKLGLCSSVLQQMHVMCKLILNSIPTKNIEEELAAGFALICTENNKFVVCIY